MKWETGFVLSKFNSFLKLTMYYSFNLYMLFAFRKNVPSV